MLVELHCHTCYSPDSILRPADLLDTASARGLDRIAITDHNTTQGALAAASIDPARVIVGEEIMTTHGELLAYFLQSTIPAGLSPDETIERLRAQGAFISVSHPFDQKRSGAWDPEDLALIVDKVDALEIFNARTLTMTPNLQAAKAAARAGLLGTAGSDAHAALEVGRAAMSLAPFADADGMRQSLASVEP
ncbi:MAG: PHP-associated domain-containing protein, partial [Anaerolineales bacterium]